MKKIFLSLLGLATTLCTHAQTRIRGQVTGADGNPISGVTIISPATITTTDEDGYFSATCADSVALTFSHPGYKSETVLYKGCPEQISIKIEANSNNLDEVEITASSENNRQLLYQPRSIVKLQEPELRRNNGLFLDDAINLNAPGVFMERRTVSGGQQFNIRGYGNGARGTNGVSSNFDGQGYKVYLNGIPVTDAEGITLMDDIDFASVSDVEITKGPSGTLYGLAIAGVVNLRTLPAQKNKITIGQDFLAGSFGLRRYTSRVRVGTEKSSLLVSYGKQFYNGFMSHTASHKDFVNVISETKINRKQRVSMYLGFSDSYDERNGELTIGQYDTLNYSGNANYIKNNAHSDVTSIRAGFEHTYQFNRHLSNSTSVFGTGISSNVSSAGGWTDKNPLNYGFRSTFDTRFNLSRHTILTSVTGLEMQQQEALTVGYAMVSDSTNLSGYNLVGAMRSNQSTISKTGTYFTQWTLAMPGDLSFTAGLGMSNMNLELKDQLYVPANNKPDAKIPRGYQTSYLNMVSPHFAVNKVFKKMFTLYASYSKGYKAPVSSYFFIPATGELNRGLVPETGEQIELGTKGNLMKKRLQYEIAVFKTVFYNKMTAVAVPLNSVTTAYSYMRNGGRQNHQGVELLLRGTVFESAQGFFRSVKPFANFAYSDFRYGTFKFQTLNSARTGIVETDYSGKVVAGVSPITVNCGIDMNLFYGLYFSINYSYRDAMYFTSDNLNQTKSFGILNSKAGIKTQIAKHFELEVFVGANNITSTQYYQMVFVNQLPDAYIPGPREINFYAGLNLRFSF